VVTGIASYGMYIVFNLVLLCHSISYASAYAPDVNFSLY
jgi:hypothetical protein